MFTLPAYRNEVHGENNRNREFTLSDKKQIIDQYFYFVENQQHQEQLRLATTTASQPQTNHKIYSDVTGELEEETYFKQKTSVRAFVEFYNNTYNANESLTENKTVILVKFGVFRWLRAYLRGDYFDWGGVNDLNKSNCRSKFIL
jgi:hypothetical protein